MADRSSAALFAAIFEHLAANPDDRAKEFARKLWDLSRGYDFNDYQMGADQALTKLGLARRGVDPGYPNDGEAIVYGPAETAAIAIAEVKP